MATVPDSWAAYAQLQARLSSRTELNDYTWGMEAGLNWILDQVIPGTGVLEDDLQRAISTAARKERDHMQRFLTDDADENYAEDPRNFEEWMQARSAIAAIAAQVREVDNKLLCNVGLGKSYEEISLELGDTATNLRSRTLRLRRNLAHLHNH